MARANERSRVSWAAYKFGQVRAVAKHLEKTLGHNESPRQNLFLCLFRRYLLHDTF